MTPLQVELQRQQQDICDQQVQQNQGTPGVLLARNQQNVQRNDLTELNRIRDERVRAMRIKIGAQTAHRRANKKK